VETKYPMLGEAPVKIYAAAQKNREIPMGQQKLSWRLFLMQLT